MSSCNGTQLLSKDADGLEHLLRIQDFSGFHCEKHRKPGRNGALFFLLPEPLPPSFTEAMLA